MTARSSTVEPSARVAVWCLARLDAKVATSAGRSRRSMNIFSSTWREGVAVVRGRGEREW